MAEPQQTGPDNTAVRVALWRAMHVEIDAKPHVLEDEIGLRIVAPPADWRSRRDMHPDGTKTPRAAIVVRSRFVEDLLAECGAPQYVVLGAGLDTFAQREPERAAHLRVFEIDQPITQAWKRERLIALGFGIPEYLRLVPVDFEHGASWLDDLAKSGFKRTKPAVIASTGVSMYLTRDANLATLRDIATLASGTTLAMTFSVPLDMVDPEEHSLREQSERGARASGTPFVSFFRPDEMLGTERSPPVGNCPVRR